MTVHSLYPDWVKLRYTSLTRVKHAILPTKIDGSATPGEEPNFFIRGGSSLAAGTCLDNYLLAVKVLFGSEASFNSYEVYHKATIDSDPIFVYGSSLTQVGTSAFTNTAFMESVMSFKTSTAGGLKLYFMESAGGVDEKFSLPVTGHTDIQGIVDFIMSDNNWIVGRNGDQPLLPLFFTTKQNDFYRRKYKL